jgi:hypothetical protein
VGQEGRRHARTRSSIYLARSLAGRDRSAASCC